MKSIRIALSLGAVLIACSDAVGPKGPSALNAFVKVTAAVSKTTLAVGDTMTFSYSVENITNDTLTLTTASGCQLQPELDQVAGATIKPPPLKDGSLGCMANDFPTITKLAKGEKIEFGIVLRGYSASNPGSGPGYKLSAGTFDASLLVRATEIGGTARSDWVRFEVK